MADSDSRSGRGWFPASGRVGDLALRGGLLGLGLALAASIGSIGLRHYSDFSVTYGESLNRIPVGSLAFYLLFTVLGGAAVLCLALALRGLPLPRTKSPSPTVAAVVAAVLGFALPLMVRIFVLRRAPVTDDEHAYLFAARILASGRLYLEGYPEVLRPFLENQFLYMGDRVFTQYFPGYPLVLALAQTLGALDLLNPLLTSLAVLATWRLGRVLTGSPGIAAGAALLLALSPAVIFSGASLSSHALALATGTWGLALAASAGASGSLGRVLAAGALLGFTMLNRPLAGLFLTGAGALLVATGPLALRRKLHLVLAAAGVWAGVVALLLLYNQAITGSPFITGYGVVARASQGDRASFQLAQVQDSRWLDLLGLPLVRFNSWLFGWPLSLLPLFFAPRGRSRAILLVLILSIWFAHLSWTSVGVNVCGAEHYQEALPAMALLASLALARHMRPSPERPRAGLVLLLVLFSAGLGLQIFLPWAAGNLGRLADRNLKPYRMIQAGVEEPALVFSEDMLKIIGPGTQGTWTYNRRNNLPDLSDQVLWLNDLGPENQAAMEYFPDRNYYLLGRELVKIGPEYYQTPGGDQ